MSDGHPHTQGPMSGCRRARSAAGRALRAAAIAVLAVTAVVLLPPSAEASAQPGIAPAMPGWTANGRLELSVTPSSRLSPNGAEITVTGSGYDRNGELWIAVCQDDGVAPEQFTHCLGGAIPDANASTAWAVVTRDGKARYAGPVNAKFSGRGKFRVTMQIPVAAGQDADCLQGSCSVYTRSADPSDRSQDAKVGISFAAPRPSSETAPSTEVVGGTPTTVEPDSVAAPEISPGEKQTVVFSTFTPKEPVDVTLYSDPIPLPAVTADDAGVVTISFEVPADLPLGEHLVQAVGRTSGIVGVADFAVVEPLVTTSTAETTTSAATDTTPASSEVNTATLSEVPIAPDETGLATTLPEQTSTSVDEAPATATDDVAPTEPAAGGSGNRLLWLWIMLAALLVIGGVVAVVALLRHRRGLDGDLSAGYDGVAGGAAAEEPEPAPSWEDLRAQAPAPSDQWPGYASVADAASAPSAPPGAMPSGLDQLFGAAAAAHQESAAPPDPTVRPDAAQQADPTQQPGLTHQPGPASSAGYDGGPATEQFQPVFHDDADQSGPSGDETARAPVEDPAGVEDEAAVEDPAAQVDDAADYVGDDPGAGRGRHHRSD